MGNILIYCFYCIYNCIYHINIISHTYIDETTVKESELENFCFKSNITLPQNEHLTPFENDLYDMVRNLEFKTGQRDFQKTSMSDLKKIQSSKNVMLFADKTANLHEMLPDQYNSLLKNNITKT